MTRVVVADDQDLVRSGLAMVLGARGVEVVGEAADGRQAVDVVRRMTPDVVLSLLRETDGGPGTRDEPPPSLEQLDDLCRRLTKGAGF